MKLLIGAKGDDPKGQILSRGRNDRKGEEEEDSGGRGGTKEDGMQRVNLLRIPLPHEQRSKSGRWGGHTKGDERVRRGRGVLRRESPFPNHLDLLFQERG